MANVKMDTDQVRAFGNKLKNEIATELTNIKTTISNTSTNLPWEGTDATEFKGTRTTDIVNALTTLITKVEELGGTAVSNADAQETTSSNI